MLTKKLKAFRCLSRKKARQEEAENSNKKLEKSTRKSKGSKKAAGVVKKAWKAMVHDVDMYYKYSMYYIV
jgi:hypothetical protein